MSDRSPEVRRTGMNPYALNGAKMAAQGPGGGREPAQPRVLSASCPDEACRSRLFFPSYDLSVECPQCGQRHDRAALRNVEEVSNPGIAFHSLIRNILVGNIVPKHGEDTVKVRGLSNYHCKLVSPLLTTYGMDKRSGKARPLSEMGAGPAFDCGVLADRAFRIDPELVEVAGYGRDVSGSLSYLRGTLALVRAHNDGEDRLLPVHVDGDGHCLVHAVSRALVGRELFWHPLRCNLKRHLEEHLAKYKELLKDFVDEKEWASIIAECDPEFLPPEGELLGLRNIHVFSLANVLRRPIILLDSLAGMQSLGDYCRPLPAQPAPLDATTTYPLSGCAWVRGFPSRSLTRRQMSLKDLRDKLPQLPRSLLPKAWGVPQSLVDVYMEFDANGCCIVGGDYHLSESYILRLTAAMDDVFYDKYGLHPTLVADVHHYVYKRTGVVGVRPSLVVSATQRALQERRLYRCLTCNGVCEHHVAPEWFRPGGLLYTGAIRNHGGLLPDKLYSFRKHGVTCWYSQDKDELIPVLSKNTLERCTWCQSVQVRHLRGDGSLELRNGDRTRTPSNSNYCSCGFKHFWDGKEYDTLPQQVTVSLEWNQKVVKDTVAWFQHECDPSLNSNVYTVASEIVNKHFPGVFGSERLLQQVVDQILEQTRLPDSMEEDRPEEEAEGVPDSAESMPACKFIIKGYKTLHKEELGVSETERRLLERIEGHAASRRKSHHAAEKKGSASSNASAACSVPTPSSVGAAAASAAASATRRSIIRVVTSDGRQGQLELGPAGTTLSELEAWVESEFGVPPLRQQLKSGVPPREIRAPEGRGGRLALSHGDRVTVEVLRDPCSPDPGTSGASAAQAILAGTEDDYLRRLQEVQQGSLEAGVRTMLSHLKRSGQTVWTYAQENPWLFCRGGLFYAQMQRDIGLVDGKHCHLPLIPDKVFTYNAAHDRLELCSEPHGHFAVSRDVEAKIAAGQVGSTGQHQSLAEATPSAAEASTSSTEPSPSTEGSLAPAKVGAAEQTKKPSATALRKGPGFTVLEPLLPPSVEESAMQRLQSVVSMLQEEEEEKETVEEASEVHHKAPDESEKMDLD
ncbi:hypothetical protein HPB47_017319 [Ixodes persulcatus]|uniref:Uncharacterized protein n=1 Tax=Ixodes persulcatus TaxID=34615 RepID=A0AC60QNR4_IXOPE|nr:hypothetical protein HPB47_017319 [Ixodes persulcatus]